MRVEAVDKILGNDCTYAPLKPLEKRVRNRLKRAEKRQPVVYLVTTADGKKYKLLKVDVDTNKHFHRILDMKPELASLTFAPEVVWNDDCNILIEYIEGEFPDFKDNRFAKAFGRSLAVLHNVTSDDLKTEVFSEKVENDLEFLVSEGVFTNEEKKEIGNKFKSLAPDMMSKGMVYGNLSNPRNFVFDEKKDLFFIDLGSFQKNSVIDRFLFASKPYREMDRAVFKESYVEAGGTKRLFENEAFLTLANCIRTGAYHLRAYYKQSPIDWRKRRYRLRRCNSMISDLKAHMSGNFSRGQAPLS